jgi:hypothetical protein
MLKINIIIITIMTAYFSGAMRDLSYNVLSKEISDNKGSPGLSADYYVSIQENINIEELKRLVCNIVYKEKIDQYKRIGVYIFFRLEKMPIIEPTDPQMPKEFKQLIGAYIQGPYRNKAVGRLIIWMDEKGNPPRKGHQIEINYFHKKDCECNSR